MILVLSWAELTVGVRRGVNTLGFLTVLKTYGVVMLVLAGHWQSFSGHSPEWPACELDHSFSLVIGRLSLSITLGWRCVTCLCHTGVGVKRLLQTERYLLIKTLKDYGVIERSRWTLSH